MKCPGSDKGLCEVNWQWDFCQDSYRDAKTGEFCTEDKLEKEEMEVALLRCSGCGAVLSVIITHPDYNAGPYNHPEWDGTDWEKEGNIWPKQ